ncbi:erythronate-4-phosphate dehydrogenase domain-containing protein [Cystoisospora suis]|uniref:Erythronate-4-phosphate dehydrogenase domain-containing protein n=1 Tax=Cystoisospora suis TaxID=483139 RepID=A0A2C6KQI9_9APIC|nr:erythronate-4-phosphate dehydrogenase domain-containing protein [Cystoisospora suis]
MDAPSPPKTTVLVLLRQEVPEDTPPTRKAPEPLCLVVYPRLLAFLREAYSNEVKVIAGASVESFLKRKDEVEQAQIVFVLDTSPELLSSLHPYLKSLRWIHIYFVGVDAYTSYIATASSPRDESLTLQDDPYFLITNGRGVFTPPLTEYVLTAMLYFTKEIPRLEKLKKDRKWEVFSMNQLQGKTVGFLGYGEIAQETAKLLQAFNMKFTVLRRQKKKEKKPSDGTSSDASLPFIEKTWISTDSDKLDFFRSADFVVSSLPSTRETQNFVGKLEFEAMKKSCIFVSIGRGSVVDEAALKDALEKREIFGAALDVFQQEPLPPSSPLWNVENLLISSHTCDWIEDHSAQRGIHVFNENLKRYLHSGVGTPPSKTIKQEDMFTPIDKHLGY